MSAEESAQNGGCSSVLVCGSVTWVNPYKGGARPTEEMEAEGRRTKPCPNQLLYVRPLRAENDAEFDLDCPPLAELRTDAQGNFELTERLVPGKYSVYRSSKLGTPAWHAQVLAQQQQQQQQQQQSSSSSAADRQARAPFRFSPYSPFSVEENVQWRRRPDASFEVMREVEVEATASNGDEQQQEQEQEQQQQQQQRVSFHWVNGLERGTPLPC